MGCSTRGGRRGSSTTPAGYDMGHCGAAARWRQRRQPLRWRRAIPPTRGLPPGPPLPAQLQTAIWSRQARRMLFACRERYGSIFTIKIVHEGTWVMLSDPEAVKQVFTGDPRVFHAGEGNQILEPVLGRNSVLVLDEKAHISQRRLLLPPFHGERMQGYRADDGRDRRPRDRELADRHPLRPAAADAGDHPRHHPQHRLRRRRGGEDCRTARRPARLPRPDDESPRPAAGASARARAGDADGLVPAADRGGRPADLPRDRRAPPQRGPRGARRHPLAAGRRPPRGRQPDERRGDARRAADPARRRPRDDRDRSLLGGRAPLPPPRQARAASARRSRPARTPT